MKILHTPVMVKEVLSFLSPGEGFYVDCTLGTGGHTRALLEASEKVKVVGIDKDGEALEVAKQMLREYGDRVTFIQGNFRWLSSLLKRVGIEKVKGILYDLGVSSLQLEDPRRGFSFQKEGPLDMRMDRTSSLTAAELLNTLSLEELEEVFFRLGEERWAGRISKFVIEERRKNPLRTTRDFVEVLRKAIPSGARRGKRIHFATRSFMALRIKVNDELTSLKEGLKESLKVLNSGGRLCVISYHSLEDRIIKNFLKEEEGKNFSSLHKGVIRPSREERERNPRSRSAKLRAAQRL